MTSSVSDILSVILLQKEANINKRLRVVPLFETLDDLKNAKSIIDIGCGAGYLTNSISYVFPDKKVLGIDFNSVATERAKKVSDL